MENLRFNTKDMNQNLSNRQLLKKYRSILSEYKSETVFGNFCARTLTRLLVLEKEVAQRGYKIVVCPEGLH